MRTDERRELVDELNYWIGVIGDRKGPFDRRFSDTARLAISLVCAGPKGLRGKIKSLMTDAEISTSEIKTLARENGITATDKEIYNAIGSLTRDGTIQRHGYARFSCPSTAQSDDASRKREG